MVLIKLLLSTVKYHRAQVYDHSFYISFPT